MFSSHTESGFKESLPGIRQKTLVFGKNTLMVEFRLNRGSVLPRHTHPHEQTGYLVSGHMTLRIENEEADVRPGDSWIVPGNAGHSATVHKDSVAIEVFSPVREEYLPKPKDETLKKQSPPAQKGTTGYCIRCGAETPLNPDKPLCFKCFPVWTKYSDPTYAEKYCHVCGKESKQSLEKPVCYTCYKKMYK
jgi:quercetin dioxygenase-like cupin family protein